MNILTNTSAWLLIAFMPQAFAANFYVPTGGDKLLGNPEQAKYIISKKDEDLIDIAVEHRVGQNEIIKVNPKVDRWLARAGRKIRIPNSYLLPDAPQKDIVLNLPEYRMYYYPKGNSEWAGQVVTNPISIGRVDWNTPLGKTKIIAKIKNPTWTPPESIRREHAAEGDILPAVFPAGPDNPLGLFAMRLGVPGYLIHSTNKPLGLGMRVSHGCVRMYPNDIKRLFPFVSVGTSVYIVNQPIKVGWSNGTLYIEAHPDLEDKQRSYQQRIDAALALIYKVNNGQSFNISGSALRKALENNDGIPVALYSGGASNSVLASEIPAQVEERYSDIQSSLENPPASNAYSTPTEKPATINPYAKESSTIYERSQAYESISKPYVDSTPSSSPSSTPVVTEKQPEIIYSAPVDTTPVYEQPPVPQSTFEPATIYSVPVEKTPIYEPSLERSVRYESQSTPTSPLNNDYLIPNKVQKELRQEEEQERDFKNSPFPH